MAEQASKSVKPSIEYEKLIQAFLKTIYQLMSECVSLGQGDQKNFLKESQQELVSQVLKFLHSIFTKIFPLSKKESQSFDKVLRNPFLTSVALNNLEIYYHQKDKNLPLSHLFSVKGKIYKKEEEGFDSDEEDEEEAEVNPKGTKGTKNAPKVATFVFQTEEEDEQQEEKQTNPDFQQVQEKLITDLKKQIQDLQDKVGKRQETIEIMTIGYLKDIQHLREMFIRKDLYPDEEYYEVTNYDIVQNFDTQVQQYIKDKLKELGTKYVTSIRNLKVALSFVEHESEQLKKTIRLLVGQKDIQGMVKAVFTLERDPYKLWQIFQQECGGNKFFFQVFDDQKRGYGIDYREIDELISKSQANERIYKKFKQGLQDQMEALIINTSKEIQSLKSELKEKNDIIAFRQESNEADIIQIKQEVRKNTEQIYQEKILEFKQQKDFEMKQYTAMWVHTDAQDLIARNMLKAALIKWECTAKIVKLIQQLSIYKGQVAEFKSQQVLEISKEYKAMLLRDKPDIQSQDVSIKESIQHQLSEMKDDKKELSFEILNLQSEVHLLKVKMQRIQYDLHMSQQRVKYQQIHIAQVENINVYFEKIYQLLLHKLGFRYQEVNLKNSKALLKKADAQLEGISARFPELSVEDVNDLSEVTLGFMKTQVAHKKIQGHRQFQDQGTITAIFNVQVPLSKLESDFLANELNFNFNLKVEDIQSKQVSSQTASSESIESLQLEPNIKAPSNLQASRRQSLKDDIVNPVSSKQRRSSMIQTPVRRLSRVNNLTPKIPNIANANEIIQSKQQLVQVEEEQVEDKHKNRENIKVHDQDIQKKHQKYQPIYSFESKKRNIDCMAQTDISFDTSLQYTFEQLIDQFDLNKKQFLQELCIFQNKLFHIDGALGMPRTPIHSGQKQKLVGIRPEQNIKLVEYITKSNLVKLKDLNHIQNDNSSQGIRVTNGQYDRKIVEQKNWNNNLQIQQTLEIQLPKFRNRVNNYSADKSQQQSFFSQKSRSPLQSNLNKMGNGFYISETARKILENQQPLI